jgi:hypothetical protein
LAREIAGINNAARIAIMATTTSNSIKVKPFSKPRFFLILLGQGRVSSLTVRIVQPNYLMNDERVKP